jgi:hypothetical protein
MGRQFKLSILYLVFTIGIILNLPHLSHQKIIRIFHIFLRIVRPCMQLSLKRQASETKQHSSRLHSLASAMMLINSSKSDSEKKLKNPFHV